MSSFTANVRPASGRSAPADTASSIRRPDSRSSSAPNSADPYLGTVWTFDRRERMLRRRGARRCAETGQHDEGQVLAPTSCPVSPPRRRQCRRTVRGRRIGLHCLDADQRRCGCHDLVPWADRHLPDVAGLSATKVDQIEPRPADLASGAVIDRVVADNLPARPGGQVSRRTCAVERCRTTPACFGSARNMSS